MTDGDPPTMARQSRTRPIFTGLSVEDQVRKRFRSRLNQPD
jgi:hypothetical protein